MQQTLYLSFTLPDGEPQKLELKPQAGEPIQIGRNRASHIKLSLPSLSRAHAKIFFESGAFWVEDLGSSNGTFVNREQIHHVRIAPGDVIQCGEFEVEVLSHAETSVYQASPERELEEVEVIVEAEGELSPPQPPALEPRPPRAPLPKLSLPPRASPPLNPTLNRTPVVHSKAPTSSPHELNNHVETSLAPQSLPSVDSAALERTEAERDALSSRVEQLSLELTQAREEAQEAHAQQEAHLKEVSEERTELERALNETREELSALRASQERSTGDVNEELNHLRAMLSALKGERAQLEADLTETRARLDTSLNDREAEVERADQLTQELSEARTELEAQQVAHQEALESAQKTHQEALQEALQELQTQRDLAQEALTRARAELSAERERAREATVASALTEVLPQPNAHATSPNWAAHHARFEQLTQELLRLKVSAHQPSPESQVSQVSLQPSTSPTSRSPQAQQVNTTPQESSMGDAPSSNSSVSSVKVSQGPQAREWRGLV